MQEIKHTPGPWHIDFDDCEADIHSGFGMVAKTMGHGKEQDDEGRANARLIAAAPELLEALGALAHSVFENCCEDDFGSMPGLKVNAQRAIAVITNATMTGPCIALPPLPPLRRNRRDTTQADESRRVAF